MTEIFWCTKAINDVVTVDVGVNDTLELEINGSPITITIKNMDYYSNYNKHVSVLVDAINKEFKLLTLSVVAKLGGIFGDSDKVRKCVVVFEGKTGDDIQLGNGNMNSLLMV